MNLNTLEKFAVQTRTELKDQVQARLTYVLEGDSAELRGRASQIEELRKRVRRSSAEEVVEEVAYTWFNRLAALGCWTPVISTPSGCVFSCLQRA